MSTPSTAQVEKTGTAAVNEAVDPAKDTKASVSTSAMSATSTSPVNSPGARKSMAFSVEPVKEREALSAVKPVPTPPTTLEEMNAQLESILYSLRSLDRVRSRGKYISQREVTNMRTAFQFTVSEVVKHVANAQPGPNGSSSSSSPIQPEAAVESPDDAPTQCPSPQIAEAERLLEALESYVSVTPLSATHQTTATGWSWRSVFHTPSERRVQSVMIFTFMFFTFIPISMVCMGLLLSSKYTLPFAILYLIAIFTFDKVEHPIKKNMTVCTHWIWNYYRDYFPCRLVVREHVRQKFDKSKNYLIGYHPHGVHTFGAIMNFGLDCNGFEQHICPGIHVHLQTLGVNFYVPFWRRLMRWMGCGDASANTIRKTLRSGPGQSVALVVGGAEESLMSRPNTNDLYLVNRKGFVKIALQEGSPLVPCYGFGENNAWRVPGFAANPHVQRVMRLVKQVTGFVPLLIVGRGFFNFSFGVLPLRTPIVVVLGEPIEVPKIAEPTAEDLEFWQQRYIAALEKLYEEHRGIYDLESTGLRIMN